MRIAILGAGSVGTTLAARLDELGHELRVGTRIDTTYGWAAGWGEVIVNATPGGGSLEALHAAGASQLAGKVLLDVANPLVTTDEGITVAPADDSLGERIQRAFPDARVVKALNTVTAAVMVDPALVPGDHILPVAGGDPDAKLLVAALLNEMGWPNDRILDLGDLRAARAMEAYLPLWLALMGQVGHARFNIALQIGAPT